MADDRYDDDLHDLDNLDDLSDRNRGDAEDPDQRAELENRVAGLDDGGGVEGEGNERGSGGGGDEGEKVQELDKLTGGLRRMWSTASLTGKLGARAASRLLRRKQPQAGGGMNEAGDEFI